MKLSEFFKRWAWGIKNLTTDKLLHAKMVGNIGNIVGLVFAWVFLIWRGFWYFSISMAFIIFVLSIELIMTYQQYKVAKDTIKELKALDLGEAKYEKDNRAN